MITRSEITPAAMGHAVIDTVERPRGMGAAFVLRFSAHGNDFSRVFPTKGAARSYASRLVLEAEEPERCYLCDEPGELHPHGKGDVCSVCCSEGLCS